MSSFEKGARDGSTHFPQSPRTERRPSRESHTRWRQLQAILVAVIVVGTGFYLWGCCNTGGRNHLHVNRPSMDTTNEFQYYEIEATEDLEWHPCWDEFQCARLSVPLNWKDAENPARVQVALVKSPARVPITDERYGGAIILNPGGPGQSGVLQVLRDGSATQTILSPSDGDDGLFFDIIGFDSRGVNNTTPHLTCFADRAAEQRFQDSMPNPRLLGADERSLNEFWAMSRAHGASCAESRGDAPNIVNFMNTPQVVQDMVAIIEKHGKWREEEAKRLLALEEPPYDRSKTRNVASTLERTRWKKGAEPLNYWGFSYGTIVGQTFAAMHPERVHRVVVDGVVDAEDYYQVNWLKNLQDTDKIIQQWGSYCLEVGEQCPYYMASEKLPAVFVALVALEINEMYENPLAFVTPRGPATIAYEDIMSALATALYAPYPLAESFAQTLYEVRRGNASSMLEQKKASLEPATLTEECERDGPFSESCTRHLSARNAQMGVICSDGVDIRNDTKDDFRRYLAELETQSDALGSYWAQKRAACINWPSRPAWESKAQISGDTAHPILFVGNTYDPVAPLRNAHSASQLFPGSVVLESDIEGHCSTATPSLCTAKAIRAYFQEGTLPEPGTVCGAEIKPWVGCVNPDGCEGRPEADQRLFEALHELASAG